jgi:hypothetical protein
VARSASGFALGPQGCDTCGQFVAVKYGRQRHDLDLSIACER